MGYNQKFWIERYSKKENILEWFENFKTYYHKLPPLEQIKKDFIEGEAREVKEIITSEKKQNDIINFLIKTITTINQYPVILKEDYERITNTTADIDEIEKQLQEHIKAYKTIENKNIYTLALLEKVNKKPTFSQLIEIYVINAKQNKIKYSFFIPPHKGANTTHTTTKAKYIIE